MQERHERGFDLWVGKIPWSRKWKLAPVFLPGKSLGQGSLVGYSPWGHKELDTTKQQSAVDLLISVVNTSLLSGAFSSCGEPLPAAQRAGSGSTAEAPGRSCSRPVGSSRTRGDPVSPTLAGRFLSTGSPGKSFLMFCFCFFVLLCLVKNYYKPITVQYSSVASCVNWVPRLS